MAQGGVAPAAAPPRAHEVRRVIPCMSYFGLGAGLSSPTTACMSSGGNAASAHRGRLLHVNLASQLPACESELPAHRVSAALPAVPRRLLERPVATPSRRISAERGKARADDQRSVSAGAVASMRRGSRSASRARPRGSAAPASNGRLRSAHRDENTTVETIHGVARACGLKGSERVPRWSTIRVKDKCKHLWIVLFDEKPCCWGRETSS